MVFVIPCILQKRYFAMNTKLSKLCEVASAFHVTWFKYDQIMRCAVEMKK